MRKTIRGTRTRGSKDSVTNKISTFGIMGGLAHQRGLPNYITQYINRRSIGKIVIPSAPEPGLVYMQGANPMDKYLLSKNPVGSGGVGKMIPNIPCCSSGTLVNMRPKMVNLTDIDNSNTGITNTDNYNNSNNTNGVKSLQHILSNMNLVHGSNPLLEKFSLHHELTKTSLSPYFQTQLIAGGVTLPSPISISYDGTMVVESHLLSYALANSLIAASFSGVNLTHSNYAAWELDLMAALIVKYTSPPYHTLTEEERIGVTVDIDVTCWRGPYIDFELYTIDIDLNANTWSVKYDNSHSILSGIIVGNELRYDSSIYTSLLTSPVIGAGNYAHPLKDCSNSSHVEILATI